MDKMIKIVVLLVIVVGGAVAYWAYSQQPAKEPGPSTPSIESGKPAKQAPPRVEEKYGVTSEGVGGG